MTETVKLAETELLKYASIILHTATPGEIELERLSMQDKYRVALRVYEVTHMTFSSTRCTKIKWEVVYGPPMPWRE